MTDSNIQDPPDSEMDSVLNIYHAGDLQATEQACNKLLKNYPRSTFMLSLLGDVFNSQGNSAAAISNYEKAIELNPNYADAFHNIGLVLNNLGRKEEAIDKLRQAVTLDPEYGDAFNNLGVLLQGVERHEEACKYLSRATILTSKNAFTFFNYAISLRAMERREEALQSYNQAIALNQNYFQAYNNRGTLLEEMNRLEEALSSYSTAIRLQPNYAIAYSNRGLILRKIGNYNGALTDLTKAIKFDSWQANSTDQDLLLRIHVNLGDIYMYLHRYNEALNCYDDALAIDADSRNIIGMKGNAIAAQGKLAEGLKLKEEGFGVVSFARDAGVKIKTGRTQ